MAPARACPPRAHAGPRRLFYAFFSLSKASRRTPRLESLRSSLCINRKKKKKQALLCGQWPVSCQPTHASPEPAAAVSAQGAEQSPSEAKRQERPSEGQAHPTRPTPSLPFPHRHAALHSYREGGWAGKHGHLVCRVSSLVVSCISSFQQAAYP